MTKRTAEILKRLDEAQKYKTVAFCAIVTSGPKEGGGPAKTCEVFYLACSPTRAIMGLEKRSYEKEVSIWKHFYPLPLPC